MKFVRPVGYIAGIPVLLHNIGMWKFKSESTGRGTQREKEIFRRFTLREISYEKVLCLLMYRFSSDRFDKNNKQR
jgi:hypothetical protein